MDWVMRSALTILAAVFIDMCLLLSVYITGREIGDLGTTRPIICYYWLQGDQFTLLFELCIPPELHGANGMYAGLASARCWRQDNGTSGVLAPRSAAHLSLACIIQLAYPV